MKNIFKILSGLFLVLFAISCSNDEATDILLEKTQEVVFDINNFIPQEVSSKGLFSAKDDGDSPHDELVPNCVDGIPSYVELTLEFEGETTEYTLKLVTLANKTETEVLKLPPGTYTVTEFVVFSEEDEVLWAAPMEGSYYEVLWDLTGVDLEFIVPEFNKLRVLIDVLCYRPYQYELFGFVWFKYAVTEIHTVCFYGDICTKFFEEWHMQRSPYFGQAMYGGLEIGYDFPAIFTVKVFYKDTDIQVNDPEFSSNAGWFGIGSPLCIEYPDQVNVQNEEFTFQIWLKMPDGTDMLIYEGEFNDTAMSEIGNEEGFGGTDGIFDFVVGNCSYDGNDANLELLPWIPIPDSADMDARLAMYEQYLIEVKFRDGTVMPAPVPSIIEEEIWYNTLCGEEFVNIPLPAAYAVEFYSSMDRELPESNFPAQYMSYPWGSINWLANQCEAVAAVEGWTYVQEALWYVINPGGTVLGDDNALALEALTHSDFIPTVGDYACVLVEPISTIPQIRAPLGYQLLLMRVDP